VQLTSIKPHCIQMDARRRQGRPLCAWPQLHGEPMRPQRQPVGTTATGLLERPLTCRSRVTCSSTNSAESASRSTYTHCVRRGQFAPAAPAPLQTAVAQPPAWGRASARRRRDCRTRAAMGDGRPSAVVLSSRERRVPGRRQRAYHAGVRAREHSNTPRTHGRHMLLVGHCPAKRAGKKDPAGGAIREDGRWAARPRAGVRQPSSRRRSGRAAGGAAAGGGAPSQRVGAPEHAGGGRRGSGQGRAVPASGGAGAGGRRAARPQAGARRPSGWRRRTGRAAGGTAATERTSAAP
jgi:hypothetical protein